MLLFCKKHKIETPGNEEHDVRGPNGQKRVRHRFRDWCEHRPLAGAICSLIASLLILGAPVSLLLSSAIPANVLWPGLLVGGLLAAMGLVELFAPSQSTIAGAAGIIFSTISLLVALGGFGIGMFLGLVGSCCALAWSPGKQIRKSLIFWTILGCALAVNMGLITLISRGEIAIAAPVVGAIHSTIGRLECYNQTAVPAISQYDHRTPVLRVHADKCVSYNIVIEQQALGRTITIRQATQGKPAILLNTTSEILASHDTDEKDTKATLVPGEQTVAVTVAFNVSSISLLQYTENSTIPDVSVTFS